MYKISYCIHAHSNIKARIKCIICLLAIQYTFQYTIFNRGKKKTERGCWKGYVQHTYTEQYQSRTFLFEDNVQDDDIFFFPLCTVRFQIDASTSTNDLLKMKGFSTVCVCYLFFFLVYTMYLENCFFFPFISTRNVMMMLMIKR